MNKLQFVILFSLLTVTNISSAQNTNKQALKVYERDGIKIKSFNFNGLEHYIKPQNDTTYIVNFWATWCSPCVEELPYFERINQEFRDKKVKIILVSLDMSKQVETRLIPYIKKNTIKSEVILLHDLDADAWINKIDSSWSGALPATLIYNTKKRLFFEQSFTYTSLLEQLNLFL